MRFRTFSSLFIVIFSDKAEWINYILLSFFRIMTAMTKLISTPAKIHLCSVFGNASTHKTVINFFFRHHHVNSFSSTNMVGTKYYTDLSSSNLSMIINYFGLYFSYHVSCCKISKTVSVQFFPQVNQN